MIKLKYVDFFHFFKNIVININLAINLEQKIEVLSGVLRIIDYLVSVPQNQKFEKHCCT